MINLNVNSETATLKSVVIGIAGDRGNEIHENNPKISKYLKQGNFPTEENLTIQVNNLAELITNNDVEVFRPDNISNQDQIFARDIGFVISDKFVVSNMKKANRRPEQQGIKRLIQEFNPNSLLYPPNNSTIEGGDVLVDGKRIYVGLTERTNYYGFEFLKNSFPDYEVIPFQMYVTDNPATNILHLDCAFQPVGEKYVILYENGFVHHPEAIYDIYGENNIIKVTQFEMYHMYPNVFSLAPDKVITDKSFTRLNNILNSKGINTFEIDYQEVGKLGGLFRCSTMPLIRK